MSEEELVIEAQHLDRWRQHKFMVLVGFTILVSLILTSVSLWLYNTGSASQLDLSRPGYERVREQAAHSGDFSGFASSGALDKAALEEFRKLYDEQFAEATAIDAFGGDVLSDKALGIDDSE